MLRAFKHNFQYKILEAVLDACWNKFQLIQTFIDRTRSNIRATNVGPMLAKCWKRFYGPLLANCIDLVTARSIQELRGHAQRRLQVVHDRLRDNIELNLNIF